MTSAATTAPMKFRTFIGKSGFDDEIASLATTDPFKILSGLGPSEES